jgi:hypothetical protein
MSALNPNTPMSSIANVRARKYPPVYHFWRAVILAGGILLIGFYTLALVGFMLALFRPLEGFRIEMNPSTILLPVILVLWVFAIAFIVGNRLPRKYSMASSSNQAISGREPKI